MQYSRVSELNPKHLSTHTFPIVVNQLNRELMKEILQTKKFKLKSSAVCAYAQLHAHVCLLHIENVDKELVAIEAEDPDVVYEVRAARGRGSRPSGRASSRSYLC